MRSGGSTQNGNSWICLFVSTIGVRTLSLPFCMKNTIEIKLPCLALPQVHRQGSLCAPSGIGHSKDGALGGACLEYKGCQWLTDRPLSEHV